MPERIELPTKGQINAISDLDVLQGLRDDIEQVVINIETDLEFTSEKEDGWEYRARKALSVHRFTARLVDRRMGALRRGATQASGVKAKAKRPPEDCDPLTQEVLAHRPTVLLGDLTTPQAVDEKMTWLVARIDAVTLDREDEIAMEPASRDEGFLAATSNLLKLMRGLRQNLQSRRGELGRAEKALQAEARRGAGQSREQMFIDVAREMLDRATFLALWDRVDSLEPQEKAA